MRVHPTPCLAMLAAAALLASACGGSSSSDPQIPPVIVSFTASPTSVAPGGASTLSWNVTGATSVTIDQGVGTVTGSSVPVTLNSTRTFTLTATNGAGSTPSTPVTVTVAVGPSALEVACAGTGCGATSPTRYSGSGIGIWRYHNATDEAVALDLGIEIGAAGVAQDLKPELIFSNGSAVASTLPDIVEVMVRDALRSDADLEREARNREHWRTTERNLETFREFQAMVREGALTGTGAKASLTSLPPPLAVGQTRTWLDMDDTPPAARPVPSTARRVCNIASVNRKLALWVADDAWTKGVTEADLKDFEQMVCGDGKGYEQLVTMIGDAWGVEGVNVKYPFEFIRDTPVRQDIHVVFAYLPNPNLGGYFWSCNNHRKGYTPRNCPDTNEALVVFVNVLPPAKPPDPQDPPVDQKSWEASTILHELTHLVNYYQRSILTETPYDTWLEEMSAMMTEDIIVPNVAYAGFTPSTPIFVRGYMGSGGAVSLMNWDPRKSYDLGSTFGAFLNRQFGTAIYSGMKSCPRGSTSYDCLDGLVSDNGGESLAAQFARMGASIYGLFPATGAPAGYGLPAKTTGIYGLAAIDASAYSQYMPAHASALGPVFQPTTQTYLIDSIQTGTTPYLRPGVVVPANTTLMVVIKP